MKEYQNESRVQFWKREGDVMVKAESPLDSHFKKLFERLVIHEYELIINYSETNIECYIGKLGGKDGVCNAMMSQNPITEDEVKEFVEKIYNEIMDGKYPDLPYKDREFWNIFFKMVEDEKAGIKKTEYKYTLEYPETIIQLRSRYNGRDRFIDDFDKDGTVTFIVQEA